MDLMTLAAKITLDDSSYKNGIKNAESLGENLKGKMSAMTVAAGNLAADMIRQSVNAISGVVSGAIDGFADYQQLIGGVETLFKSSSDKVTEYAKQSFKTTGLSANDYMETVTSFSASLLQGLNGDTNAAADLANTAIQDMADNANKMGTDISAIQTAYQGFAKQNYTMLDNLKLGYGGTQQEMVRLVNDSGILDKEIKNLDGITFDQLIQAIHAIQEQMGITGTTAKEAAETISGSKASLAASWEDLLAVVGGAGMMDMDTAVKNFEDSFSAYMTNFLPTLTTTLVNSGTLVTAIANAITSIPTDLLSTLTSAGLEAGTEMIGGVSDVVNWLIESLANMMYDVSANPEEVAEFGNAVGEFIGSAIRNLALNFEDIAGGLIAAGVSLAANILDGLWEGLFGEESGGRLEAINQQLDDTISDTEITSARAEAILTYMDKLYKKYGDAVGTTREWQDAENQLESVLGGSKDVFTQYGKDVQGAIDKLKGMTQELRKLAIQQAMQDKLSAQYKLLGEYEQEKFVAQQTANIAQSEIQLLDQKVIETAKAYAQEIAAYSPTATADYEFIQKAMNGESITSYERDLMAGMLQNFYDMTGVKEEDQIWNRSEFDNILSPEVLKDLNVEYEAQQRAIEDAEKAVEDAQKSIDNVADSIKITMGAIDLATQELNSMDETSDKTEDSLAGVKSSANFADRAMSALGNTLIGAINWIANTIDSANSGYGMPRAVGLSYVPYDGFKAELHRGEAILTKEENERRGSTDLDAIGGMIEESVGNAMARVNIFMSGERVADLTADRARHNAEAFTYSRVRGMGGH